MASAPVETPPIPQAELDSFSEYLRGSKRILALCGAGLSAASGLPTFRGAGGYWRAYEATSLATLNAFRHNPSLVWQFYSYRRHMALKAKPNPAHYALAELARKKPEFLTITQNVDGLSQRANHPSSSIEFLHGSLSTVKCASFYCDYIEHENFRDPIVPALTIPQSDGKDLDIGNPEMPLKDVDPSELPQCPSCKGSLLRPGVVWFGEGLPTETLSRVDEFIEDKRGIDLLLVIGTSAVVYPAAGYIDIAISKGARVAIINTEKPEIHASRLRKGDWYFQGDAGILVPQILEAATGPVSVPQV